MMLTASLAFLALLGVSNAALPRRTESYKGERVYHCSGVTNFSLHEPSVDVWAEYPDRSVDVRIANGPGKHDLEQRLLAGSTCEVRITDVEEYVRNFEEKMKDAEASNAEWFEAYHTYSEIYTWYSGLATQHPTLVKFNPSIGESTEGRNQPAVHITAGSSGNATRPRFYFQCQIHAREWISGATCMYIVDYLVTNYQQVEEVTRLLEEVELIVVPLANPDGYEYTWNGDRLWRKNRRVNAGSTCRGVDQNRNYNIRWGQAGSSSNPCSETYHGIAAESERETINTANYFKDNVPVIGAIDWHSYSQLILRPWGFTNDDAPDEARMKAIGDTMSDLIYAVHQVRYSSEKSIGLYPTSGTTSDWFYSDDANRNNLGYRSPGYTIELRDTGRYGFLLPPDQIIPTGQELVPAIMHFMSSLAADPVRM